MQTSISESSPAENHTLKSGVDILLNDIETESYLQGQIVLGLIDQEHPSELNEEHAEFFLKMYFDAYMSERREFTIVGEDIGRLSWIHFICNELSYLHGTENLELSEETKKTICKNFGEYVKNYVAKNPSFQPSSVIIAESTKESMKGIVK